MRKDNTPNYQTPYSRLQHFRDFTQNINKVEDELAKVDRQQIQDHDSDYELPNEFRQNYNKVSSKYDSNSKEQIKDKLSTIRTETSKKPEHKYKFSNDEVNPNHFFKNQTDVVEPRIIKKFETFGQDLGYDPQTPKLNISLEMPSNIEDEEMELQGCGCCDDCTGESNCECCDDCTCDTDYDYSYDEKPGCCGNENCNCDNDEDIEFESDEEVKSYMFFGNLETIHRLSSNMLELDEQEVNDLLNEGHNWAEDHISVTKELISHVYNFLMNKAVQEHISVSGVEHGGGHNYMFFGNLQTINQFCEEMLELDRDVVDELLENGHDWAEDHLAAAKEDILQVYEWLQSEFEN